MKEKLEKPSPEAKALSLFLMAYKKSSPLHKEKSIRLNKLWSKVAKGDLDMIDYLEAVRKMLAQFGGYAEVVEKTVSFYIDKTGEWTLKGNDKYCLDAKRVANRMLGR